MRALGIRRPGRLLAWLVTTAGCALALSSNATAAGLEDAINAITKPTMNRKSYFAVIDIKSERSVDDVSDAVLNGIRRYANNARLTQKIPTARLPVTPARMRLLSGGEQQVPQCDGDVANVVANELSFAKYGEATVTIACIFAYRGGYQVNFFASFLQRSGGPNSNVLGAMLGRLVTNAIGLGDSSSFIGKTLEAIQEKLADVGMKGSLVELHPSIPGLEVARDDAHRVADETATMPTPVAPSVAGAAVPVSASRQPQSAPVEPSAGPPAAAAIPVSAGFELTGMGEVANAMAEVSRRIAEARAAMAGQVETADAQPSPLQARKELAAMGLSYFDGAQFHAALKRGDVLAVRLYVAAKGVDLKQPGPEGLTPLQSAHRNESQPELLGLLRNAGAE